MGEGSWTIFRNGVWRTPVFLPSKLPLHRYTDFAPKKASAWTTSDTQGYPAALALPLLASSPAFSVFLSTPFNPSNWEKLMLAKRSSGHQGHLGTGSSMLLEGVGPRKQSGASSREWRDLWQTHGEHTYSKLKKILKRFYQTNICKLAIGLQTLV